MKQLPKLLPALLVLSAFTTFVTACGDVEPGPRDRVPAEASSNFRLPTLDGDEIGPPDFAGQVVVVDFWATWCGPCHKQAAEIAEVLGEYDDVQFLAVDLGEKEEDVRAHVEENPFGYPVLLDPDEEVTSELGIYGLPTVMVVDPQGKITYFETGILDAKGLRREIDAARGA